MEKCNSCFGNLKWKRKTKNVLGWVLRIYTCDDCGLETKIEEAPKSLKKVNVLDLLTD